MDMMDTAKLEKLKELRRMLQGKHVEAMDFGDENSIASDLTGGKEEEGEEQVPEEPHTGHVETIPYVVQIEEPAHDSSESSDDDKPVTPPRRPRKRSPRRSIR